MTKHEYEYESSGLFAPTKAEQDATAQKALGILTRAHRERWPDEQIKTALRPVFSSPGWGLDIRVNRTDSQGRPGYQLRARYDLERDDLDVYIGRLPCYSLMKNPHSRQRRL